MKFLFISISILFLALYASERVPSAAAVPIPQAELPPGSITGLSTVSITSVIPFYSSGNTLTTSTTSVTDHELELDTKYQSDQEYESDHTTAVEPSIIYNFLSPTEATAVASEIPSTESGTNTSAAVTNVDFTTLTSSMPQIETEATISPVSSYGSATPALHLQSDVQTTLALWALAFAAPVVLGLAIGLLLLIRRCILAFKGDLLDRNTLYSDGPQIPCNRPEERQTPLPQPPYFPPRNEPLQFAFPPIHIEVERELLSAKHTYPSASTSVKSSSSASYDDQEEDREVEAPRLAAFLQELDLARKAREEEEAAQRTKAEVHEHIMKCLALPYPSIYALSEIQID